MNSLRHCVEYTESSRELVRISGTEGLQATAGLGTWGIVEEPCPVNLNWLVLEKIWVESLETPKDNTIRRYDD
jgi:hypothetical protein